MTTTVNNINIKNDLITYDPSLERKIDDITEGLSHQYADRLYKIRKDNASSIVGFLLSMKTEINLSYNHVKNNIMVLTLLSQFHNNQISFKEMTKEDILLYLNRLRKPEVDDPLHKWVGSYNLYSFNCQIFQMALLSGFAAIK